MNISHRFLMISLSCTLRFVAVRLIAICFVAATFSGVVHAQQSGVALLKTQVIEAAGGEANLPALFRMKDTLKVGNNPDKPAKTRDAVLEPPEHWWIGKRDRVVKGKEPATFLVWAWMLGALADDASKLESLPDLTEGDRTLVGLRVSETITPPLDMYFDPANHRLVRIDWRADIHRFDQWKEVSGFRYPSKCDGFKKAAKKPWYQCEILELEVLKNLPEGLTRENPES